MHFRLLPNPPFRDLSQRKVKICQKNESVSCHHSPVVYSVCFGIPSSSKAPTTSLRIDNFLRPFTLKAVQEFLGKTGTVVSFWMDQIKTHCYVTVSLYFSLAAR
ncbi:putative acinus, RNA recognition [Helianthus annuus]|nr:putative acinus, RNA recognition [Helianthus annuus]KAJ0647774.1 putative acinus, RNA recognition [Helianthus annuus]KAJ0651641.1 putative acinus, RNA recognition [Helianthus annuus]